MKSHYLNQTSSDPDKSISLQTSIELKKKIIYAIKLYKKGQITLRGLIRQIEKIKTVEKIPIPDAVEDVIEELNSLSIIEDVLNDILQELQKK